MTGTQGLAQLLQLLSLCDLYSGTASECLSLCLSLFQQTVLQQWDPATRSIGPTRAQGL